MGHYRANLDDLTFNLFEVLHLGASLPEDLDEDVVRSILREVADFAEGPVADSFVDADRNPPVFDPATHAVHVPDPLSRTVQAIKDAEWWRIGMDAGLGGTPAPSALKWAIAEMVDCANPAAIFLTTGPMMGSVLYAVGNPQQKRWAREAIERGWSGTMVLTEPGAGSGVGAGRTTAVEQSDGTWHITGVKRFISGGDVGDTASNVFHLVLARPQGAGPGTKGLSLFFVPKYHFDPDTMELGERNGVYVTNLEHKMGIKSSPTCELAFGPAEVPAVGWLVGDRHEGIAQMFQVIENARMMVGVKSAGTLSTGYLNALDFAQSRIQGPDMLAMSDKTAPRVSILQHPDVRRSLLLQKAYAEGLRALYLYAAAHQEPMRIGPARELNPELAHRINDLLLPVVKGFGSERAYAMLTQSLQTLGGSGYLQDYPIEQYVRDVKIDSLYEGTTAIQALDLFFRKIVGDQGAALGHLLGGVEQTCKQRGQASLSPAYEQLGEALAEFELLTGTMGAWLLSSRTEPRDLYRVGLSSVRYLEALGTLLVAWRLIVNAEVAASADMSTEARQGKTAIAQLFAAHELPAVAASRVAAERLDVGVMSLPAGAF